LIEDQCAKFSSTIMRANRKKRERGDDYLGKRGLKQCPARDDTTMEKGTIVGPVV